jgi:hypothetical protein
VPSRVPVILEERKITQATARGTLAYPLPQFDISSSKSINTDVKVKLALYRPR